LIPSISHIPWYVTQCLGVLWDVLDAFLLHFLLPDV
jgi:hypothetical protein